MQNKGFLKRALPFAVAVVIGLFITSLFVDIKAPAFGGKHKRKAEMRKLRVENEQLRNENLRLRNLVESMNLETKSIDLETGEMNVFDVPVISARGCDRQSK